MRASRRLAAEAVALVLATVFFLVPFALMLLTAVKDPVQALDLDFAWPVNWRLVENFTEVIEARDYVLLRAYVNSTVLTVVSVALIVVFAAMAAFVLQRRPGSPPRATFLRMEGQYALYNVPSGSFTFVAATAG